MNSWFIQKLVFERLKKGQAGNDKTGDQLLWSMIVKTVLVSENIYGREEERKAKGRKQSKV